MRWIVIAAGIIGVTMGLGAVSPGYWWYALSCIVTGFATVTMLTTANGYVQTTARPDVRGRVLAIYFAMLMGGTFIGAPTVGWIAANWGPRMAIATGASAGFIAFVIGLVTSVARRRQITAAETGAIPVVTAMSEERSLPTGTVPIDSSVDSPHG